MNIAIISYNHPESSIVLAKHIAEKHHVDYFYITDRAKQFKAGLGYLSHKKFRVGLNDITLKKEHPLYNYLYNINIKIHVIAYPTFRPRLKWLNELLTPYFIRKLKKNKYDIVNLIGQQELILAFHKFFKKAKVVHTLHEVAKHYNEQSGVNSLINYLYVNQIPVIVHSATSYDRLMEQYPFNKDIVFKIPFGLFETYRFFSTGTTQQEQKTVLFYGLLRPYKGLLTFIKAIKYAQEQLPGIKAIIAGDGYDEALSLIKNDDSFHIINRYSDNHEIVALNEKAAIVVCPYTSASQSGIIMTSYLFNKPIIASEIGGFKESIIHEKTGYLVKINDFATIGDYIVKLLTDNNILKKMQQNIQDTYSTGEYNWDNIADTTIECYNLIIKNEKTFTKN